MHETLTRQALDAQAAGRDPGVGSITDASESGGGDRMSYKP